MSGDEGGALFRVFSCPNGKGEQWKHEGAGRGEWTQEDRVMLGVVEGYGAGAGAGAGAGGARMKKIERREMGVRDGRTEGSWQG